MEPYSVSHQPDSPDGSIERLQQDGYSARVEGAYLVVRNVPYLDRDMSPCVGALACPLQLLSPQTVGPPPHHQIYFSGSYPHDLTGNRISQLGEALSSEVIAPDFTASYFFQINH